MEKVLRGKKILVVEDEPVCCSLLVNYLNSLGAVTMCASNGEIALQKIATEIEPELIFCDLNMPLMNGLEFISHMAKKGLTIPVIIVSATKNMMKIDDALRLGAKDILLKPILNLNEIKKVALNYLYPQLFSSEAIERSSLVQELTILKQNTIATWRVLKQLQPPVSQIIANCRVNYRLLNTAGKTGLVFDIAAISEKEMMFYCFDVSHSKDRSAISALLLKVAFNNILKKRYFYKKKGLPGMQNIMHWLKQVVSNGKETEPLSLLLGYYDTHNKTILLSSAGLDAHVKSDDYQKQLDNGIPFRTLEVIHADHDSKRSAFWQCRIWNNRNQIKLMFSPSFN
ncbi:two-component system response regulator RssB [Xenorhabdus sp. Vera]|uniref:two-component system response regulator RssB n=1 Tax=Xenorhabdus koppenhoeferi TaxID=351659 RepID=UPI0019CADA0C|nr:two-component system response regulator RssB [Xenorhabdus sp. Vera]MBD2811927.1 two-component system response regulator RssB [Xenorhabdus sp. Vera]